MPLGARLALWLAGKHRIHGFTLNCCDWHIHETRKKNATQIAKRAVGKRKQLTPALVNVCMVTKMFQLLHGLLFHHVAIGRLASRYALHKTSSNECLLCPALFVIILCVASTSLWNVIMSY